MFHSSEISRKILGLLNHVPPSPEQAGALACAVPRRCPAASPTARAGMLVEPDVVPPVLERSRAAQQTQSPRSQVHHPTKGDHAGGGVAVSWQLASSAPIVWSRGKIRRTLFPAVGNVPFLRSRSKRWSFRRNTYEYKASKFLRIAVALAIIGKYLPGLLTAKAP